MDLWVTGGPPSGPRNWGSFGQAVAMVEPMSKSSAAGPQRPVQAPRGLRVRAFMHRNACAGGFVPLRRCG